MMNTKDITGRKFHHLKALNFAERRLVKRKNGSVSIEYYWNFLCDCGNTKFLRRDRVTTGKNPIISCGCKINKHKFTGFEEISGSQWGVIKKNAKVRNLEFKISIEDVWKQYIKQNRKCALTGMPIEFSCVRPWYNKTTASLDRIDNSKGYIEGNIQWVHKKINVCKWEYSIEEFVDMCKSVTNYMKDN